MDLIQSCANFVRLRRAQYLYQVVKLLLRLLRGLLLHLILVGYSRRRSLNRLRLISILLELLLLKLLTMFGFSLHRVDLLSLNHLVFLLLYEVILGLNFLVEAGANPWELERLRNIPSFESLGYFLFEHNELFLHFWVYVPLLVSWPKSPKSIAFDVTGLGLLLDTKNIFS